MVFTPVGLIAVMPRVPQPLVRIGFVPPGLSSHDPADVALVVVAVLSCGPLRLVGIFEQLQGKKIGLRTPE
jgi:hypothetical protein